jgi:hypothetical protein
VLRFRPGHLFHLSECSESSSFLMLARGAENSNKAPFLFLRGAVISSCQTTLQTTMNCHSCSSHKMLTSRRSMRSCYGFVHALSPKGEFSSGAAYFRLLVMASAVSCLSSILSHQIAPSGIWLRPWASRGDYSLIFSNCSLIRIFKPPV